MGRRTTGSGEATSTEQVKNGSSSSKGSGSGGNGGRGGTTETGTTEKERIPRLVPVEVPGSEEDKEAAKKAKAAERQRKSRAAKKAAATSSKQTVALASNSQMKVMLMTLSGIMAARPGMEVWALSQEEAEQIVTPLSAIMAKSNVGETVGEYADHIALVIACFTIFIPKFLAWQQTKPKKEEVKYVKHQTTGRGSTNQTGTSETSNRPSTGQHTDNLSNVNEAVSQLIPASIGI